jgi:DNA polymerase III epsilon subunit-like protein
VSTEREVFVSVDVETAGPIPGEYSLLSIGACCVDDPSRTFACELKPMNRNADPSALKITGLCLEKLEKTGLPPKQAMQQFDTWLTESIGLRGRPVFVGLNAPFDWSFVNYYFHCFVGRNPFGFTALDIKAYYMGATGCSWADTRSSRMAVTLGPGRKPDHQALSDAQYQAELFRLIRAKLGATNR